MGNYWGFEHVV